MDQQDVQAHGWDAIDKALEPIYHGQTPKHFGTVLSYALGGNDPLQGISAYKRLQPVPHWHFVTYGFSELYEKETDNPEYSGWGFELSFRLLTEPDSEEPPTWALNFLQNLARYVFNSGNVFNNGDYLNANGPIALEEDTLIHSVVFSFDPELPPIATPNGRVEFLQVTGITTDEELAIKQWRTLDVLDVFREYLPLLVTDLGRRSLLEKEEIRARLKEGAARDGSNTGHIYVDQLSWAKEGGFVVTLGARQVGELLGILPNRLAFGREFSLVGKETEVNFFPADSNTSEIDEDTLRLGLTSETVAEIGRALEQKEGRYPLKCFDGLAFQVAKTFIRDGDDNVVETIG